MTTPTVVLVPGAFADGSSAAPLARRLLDTGLDVRTAVAALGAQAA